jgi:hypothetical protein
MSEATDASHGRAAARLARRRLALRIAAVCGGLLGLCIALCIALGVPAWLAWRDRPPTLGRAELEQARERWRQNGPASYDLAVRVSGLRAAVYRVEVRDGVAVSATIDGRPLRDRRTFATWSVPGMFATMEADVEHVETRAVEAVPRSARLALYGTFHARLGYPQRYHRIEWGEAGTDQETTWEVLSFQPR